MNDTLSKKPVTPAQLAAEISELIAKRTASPENPGTFAQPFLWRTSPLTIDEVVDLQKQIEERLSDACFQCSGDGTVKVEETPRTNL